MYKKTFKSLMVLSALCYLPYPIQALAAQVPEGVVLAKKQKVVRNNSSEPASIDPHKIEGVPEATLARDLYETLTTSGPNGEVLPGVAESWTHKDMKTWTFKLRKDAKWSNGDPLTAHDFVYSFRRLADPKTASPYASYLDYVHIKNSNDVVLGKASPETLGVRAEDDHTLVFELNASVPYLPAWLVHSSVSPVHKKTVEKYGNAWTKVGNFVGNGAYKPKEWVVNERIVLERSPTYWDNKNTVVDEVVYLAIPSSASDVARYKAGEIDMTNTEVPIEQFAAIKKDYPKELYQEPSLCTYFYELNHKIAPFNDKRVREAVKLALDVDTITTKVKRQFDIPAYGYTPYFTDGMKLDKPEWVKLSYRERVKKAKKLLAEAGYSKKNPLKFTLLYNSSESHKLLAVAAASMWKRELGVEVELQNMDWKNFLETRRKGTHQASRAGWCADYNEPTTFLTSLLSTSSNNTTGYSSVEYDNLLNSAFLTNDSEERVKIYQKAEKMLDDESVILPVYWYASPRLVKPYLKGYSGKNPLMHYPTKDMYIVKP